MTETITIGKLILDILVEKNGSPCPLWGLCGAATYPFDDDIQTYVDKGLIQYNAITNESSGGLSASYFSHQDTLQIGTLLTTAGPGTTSAITSIANAYNEEVPLLTLCGVPYQTNFQYVEPEIMQTITKAIFTINSTTTNITQMVKSAISICHQGTPDNPGSGPVVIFILKNMFDATVYVKDQIYIASSLPRYNFTNLFFKVQPFLTSDKKIVIRLGRRVSSKIILEFARLSTIKRNIIVSLLYNMSTSIPDIWNEAQYPNVVLEGPLSTFTFDNIYSQVDTVIEIGLGILYSLIDFMDVTQIADITFPTNSVVLNFDDQIYEYSQAPSAYMNVYVGNNNQFALELIERLKLSPPSSVTWKINYSQDTQEFGNLLFTYSNQQNPSTLNPSELMFTSATVIASIFLTIYSLQSSCLSSPFIIFDNNLYVGDVGAAGFITGQLCRHSKKNHVQTFSQFSPIGCSPAVVAGRLLSGSFDDAILFIGDGGFLNVSSYVIDLHNMLILLKKRCLFIFANDLRYSNVAIAEENLFGSYTALTSTQSIQQNVLATSILECITTPLQHFHISPQNQQDIWNGHLSNFIETWYTITEKTPGITLITILTSAIPTFITYQNV